MSDERLSFPRAELRRRTARGAIVNGVFLGGGEGLAVLQGLIVTILLGPAAIGLYGIVTTTAMTIVALKRVGIDEAFVQQSEEGQEQEFQRAFTLELMLAIGFSVVIMIVAPIVSAVYGDDRLLWLTLAVAYLPVAFALQSPSWIFFRRMDFIPRPNPAIHHPGGHVRGHRAAGRRGRRSLEPRDRPVRGQRHWRDRGDGRVPLQAAPAFRRGGAQALLRVLVARVRHGVLAAAAPAGPGAGIQPARRAEAAGFITLAFTLTRYADRADQVVATTIYPAICVVSDQLPRCARSSSSPTGSR